MASVPVLSEKFREVGFTDHARWGKEGWSATLEDLARQRKEAPVFWSEADRAWIVTRLQDVTEVSRDQGLFTSEGAVRMLDDFQFTMLTTPPEHHIPMRKLIKDHFTKRQVAKLEDGFRDMTINAVEKVAAAGGCDFVDDIAIPLPLRFIATMLGVPDEGYERFRAASDTLVLGDSPVAGSAELVAAGEAFVDYSNYVVDELLEKYRKDPQNNLLSILAAGSDDIQLIQKELYELSVLLMAAGNETTRNSVSFGLHTLLNHPDQLQAMADDPALIPNAVEEILRYISPVRFMVRKVVEDTTELGGQVLKQGDKVVMMYPAANRDPEIFEDPDRFDIYRKNASLQIAFGRGAHVCLGAMLARMEMKVILEEFLGRVQDIKINGPVVTVGSSSVAHFKHLPLSLARRTDTPAPAPRPASPGGGCPFSG